VSRSAFEIDMGHAPSDFQTSIGSFTTASLTSIILACSPDADAPGGMADSGSTTGDTAECFAQLEEARAECLPGMNFQAILEQGEGSILLIDDPGASVSVGPNAWLARAGGEGTYVASDHFDGMTCTVACGWCQLGQSLCHQGFDDTDRPIGCMMCLPYDIADIEDQCATFIAACSGADDD
jgi:hypothetical protein